jgi:outer membrane biogenesis lipoprotein LolB
MKNIIRLTVLTLTASFLTACVGTAGRSQVRQETRVQTRTENRMENRGW